MNDSATAVAVVPFDWNGAGSIPPLVVSIDADVFLHAWPTFSGPAEFLCSDGNRYVIKALRTDRDIARAIFNDQVIARLGAMIEAPVGEVQLINLGQDIISINTNISYMQDGVAHATRRINDVTERLDSINYGNVIENKSRYASLSILYCWIGASGDRQFVFGITPPCLVYSVDHGHFFPGGPDWTVASLASHSSNVQLPADIMAGSSLTIADLNSQFEKLKNVTETDVLRAVMAPPLSWGIPVNDRVALGEFLWRQRERTLTLASVQP